MVFDVPTAYILLLSPVHGSRSWDWAVQLWAAFVVVTVRKCALVRIARCLWFCRLENQVRKTRVKIDLWRKETIYTWGRWQRLTSTLTTIWNCYVIATWSTDSAQYSLWAIGKCIEAEVLNRTIRNELCWLKMALEALYIHKVGPGNKNRW